MKSHGITSYRERNHLLRALPLVEYDQLRPVLESVSLGSGDVLHQPNQPIEYVYFPQRSVLSVLTVMSDGEAVESVTIGQEGMLGIAVFLGATASSSRGIAQVPDTAVRVRTAEFQRLLPSLPALSEMLRSYAQVMIEQASQSVACNRLHALSARCARWLLTTHDRAEGQDFRLTQEFLANMLGVHRPAVSIAAGQLQKQGLIKYHRGAVTVVDRDGLEKTSCECYEMTEKSYRRLMGPMLRSVGREAGAN